MKSELSTLCKQIRSCKICLDCPWSNPLPHSPRPVFQVSETARICISGQAPGTRVHRTGIPFNDPSGDRLRQWLGLDRDQFYNAEKLAIIPMGFCFPGLDHKGSDLPPRPECVSTWHDKLFELLPQLKLIIAIGQYAHSYHLGERNGSSVTETVGNWREYLNPNRAGSIRYLPLPHPSWRNSAWLKKNIWFGEEVLPALKSEVNRLVC